MASITFTDAAGTAVLENGKPVGADRLQDWTPRDESIGPVSFAPATGRLNGAKYRRDGLVSFKIPWLPGSTLPTALRLKLHLMKGGQVQLDAGNVLASRWAFATLAPETVPSIDFDAELKEYIFGVTLRESAEILPAPTVIAFDDPTTHPDAFLVELFGGEAPDYATWKTQSASKYDTTSFNDSRASFDATQLFDGNASLKTTGASAFTLGKGLSPGKAKIRCRSWIWMDAGIGEMDVQLGARIHDPAGGPSFTGVPVYAHNEWYPDSIDNPFTAEGFLSYDYEEYTPEAFGAKPFDDVKGRWIPVIQYATLDGTNSTYRMAVDGDEIITSVHDSDFTGVLLDFLTLKGGCDTTGNTAWYGKVEFVDGDVNDDPWGLG